MELIGYASDERPASDDNPKGKSFDQIKAQQYATQSVDRIYRLASSAFILVQLNSSIKSDRLWPISEQVKSSDDEKQCKIQIIFGSDIEQIRFIQVEQFESCLHHSIAISDGLCDHSR